MAHRVVLDVPHVQFARTRSQAASPARTSAAGLHPPPARGWTPGRRARASQTTLPFRPRLLQGAISIHKLGSLERAGRADPLSTSFATHDNRGTGSQCAVGSQPAVAPQTSAALANVAPSRATAFEQAWRGAMPMTGPRLAEALLEARRHRQPPSARVHSYASLHKAVDGATTRRTAISAAVEQGVVQVLNALRFLRARVARAGGRPRRPSCRQRRRWRPDRHYLEALRRFRRARSASPRSACWPTPMPLRSAPGRRCSARATRSISTAATAGAHGRPAAGVRARPRDADVRRAATLYAALGPHTPVLARCLRLAESGDRLVLDGLRLARRRTA